MLYRVDTNGLCTIVAANSAVVAVEIAKREFANQHDWKAGPATEDDLEWHKAMGGEVLEDVPPTKPGVKVGDPVTVTQTWYRRYTTRPGEGNHYEVTWYPVPCEPWDGIFVGWAWVHEGTKYPRRYVNDLDGGGYEPGVLIVSRAVKVAKVQRTDGSQRYRVPELCVIAEGA